MAYNFRIDMLSACSVMNKIFFILIWHVIEVIQLFIVFVLESRLSQNWQLCLPELSWQTVSQPLSVVRMSYIHLLCNSVFKIPLILLLVIILLRVMNSGIQIMLLMISVVNKLYRRLFLNIIRFIQFDPKIALCFCSVFICVDPIIVIIYDISIGTEQ